MYQKVLFCLCFASLIACKSDQSNKSYTEQLSADDRSQLSIVPLPYHVDLKDESLTLSEPINWVFEGATDLVSKQAFSTTSSWFDNLLLKKGDQTWTITLSTENSAPDVPHLHMDESYTLEVEEYEITLTAATGIGVERGLQTLKQLISNQNNKYTIPRSRIHDNPRYSWRGLMIDVSRHFMPLEILYQNIDAMAIAKMNVLHLHLTDNQGFRIESKTYPKLHELGSGGQYYTQAEMKELIQYAAKRGIRIVPEFDMPGHASGWLTAYPEYGVADKYNLQERYGVFSDAIDPTNQDVYLFLASFIKEMTALFPDRYIHIGSDEVIPTEWQQSDEITQFMDDKGLNSYNDLQTYFNLRMSDIMFRAKKKMITWDEAIRPELAKSGTTTQAWRSKDAVFSAISLNSPAILSHGWYLDHKLPMSELYEVDPSDQPDYMNIEIDRDNWSAYELSSPSDLVNQGSMMFLFGSKENSRGILNMMGQQHIINEIDWEDNAMNFSFTNAAGPLNVELEASDKQLNGSINLSFVGIPITGSKVGGHDMVDGMVLPKFHKPPAPRSDQLDMILGGEAAMWSEWVDETNVNSRIWPRTLAVAEKLWSPKSHTTDTEDLYRRVSHTTAILSEIDAIDDDNVLSTLSKWTSDPDQLRSLFSFLNLLEEVKYYNRWQSHPNHTINTAMTRVADIVQAESIDGYEFNKLVSQQLDNPSDENRSKIIRHIANWSGMYDQLKSLIIDHPDLRGIEYHALVLSDLSKMYAVLSSGRDLSANDLRYIESVKNSRQQSRDGTTLSVLPGLLKLIVSEQGN